MGHVRFRVLMDCTNGEDNGKLAVYFVELEPMMRELCFKTNGDALFVGFVQ